MLILLNGKTINRGSAGKFITIYPESKTDFKTIIESLYHKLIGFQGPYILSDKRYKDSKVIFYRYGGILNKTIINYRGEREYVLRDPDGNLVTDKRVPYWNPPFWIEDIFDDESETDDNTLILSKRYQIIEPIAFSVDGGVYKAIDITTNKTVIVKEARPYTAFDINNIDSVDRLHNEFNKLSKIKGLNISPRPIDIFKEWEHTFLVEEYLEGTTLSSFVMEKNPLMRGVPSTELYKEFYNIIPIIFKKIAQTIDAFHSSGIVIQDLSLRNFIIDEKHQQLNLKLIDLESSYTPGREFFSIKTPGFYLKDKDFPNPFEEEVHNIALLFMGSIFPLNNIYDLDAGKTIDFLNSFKEDSILPSYCFDLIKLLLNRKIKSAKEIINYIERWESTEFFNLKGIEESQRFISSSELQIDIERLKNSIYNDMTPDRNDRLFPNDPMGSVTNNLNIGYGSMGVLYVLNHIEDNPNHKIRKGIGWSLLKDITVEDYAPNFFTGLAGIAWGFSEIGLTNLADTLIRKANKHPLAEQSSDLFYGLSGIGLTNLYFYKKTKKEYFLKKSIHIGEKILYSAKEDTNGDLYWQDSNNNVFIGYGRGGSGIALFLLYLFLETEDEKFYEYGKKALNHDMKYLVLNENNSMSLPRGVVGGLENVQSPYLYDGSAGVGCVLLRYYIVRNDQDLLEKIHKISLDSMRKYTAFPSLMRGLSGLGNFMLDCYQFLGIDKYLSYAFTIYRGIKVFAMEESDTISFPGEQLYRISHDYSTGGAGILLFMERLKNINKNPFNFNFFLDHYYNL